MTEETVSECVKYIHSVGVAKHKVVAGETFIVAAGAAHSAYTEGYICFIRNRSVYQQMVTVGQVAWQSNARVFMAAAAERFDPVYSTADTSAP